MVDLKKFFPESVGATERIQAKIVFWVTVGHGSFSQITSSDVKFSGKGKVMGHDFDVNIELNVIDNTNMTIEFNGSPQKATYYVDHDNNLIITIPSGAEKGTIRITTGSGGTYFYPKIAHGHDVWIGA